MPIKPDNLKAFTDVNREPETGKNLLKTWGDFGDLIQESADTFVDLATEIGDGLLVKEDEDFDEDVEAKVYDAVSRMPDELVEGLAEHVAERSMNELRVVAETLTKDEKVKELVAGLLRFASIMARDFADGEVEGEDNRTPEELGFDFEDDDEEPANPDKFMSKPGDLVKVTTKKK